MMMMTNLYRTLAVALLGFGATSAFAQAGTDVASAFTLRSEPLVQSTGGTSALHRSVTVKFRGTRLEIALQDIAKRAGLELSYVSSVIPADARVTYTGTNVTANSALDAVLRGTGLIAVSAGEAKVNLVRGNTPAVQEEGTLAGIILSAETKQPVANATILVGDGKLSVTTGSDGRFRIAVPVGEHRVTVRAVGFTRKMQQVMIRSEETTSIDVVLSASASVLDEVVVTGSVVATERKSIPTPITVITAEEIERRGITRIEQFFRGEVPGVTALDVGAQSYISNPGAMQTSKMYARGASTLEGSSTEPNPNPLKTYVDGVEMLDPSYLGTIDPQSIERIEIVTGPQAATLYGSGAMGGVMQIFTKKGNSHQSMDAVANLRYGIIESNLSSGKTPKHQHTIGITGSSGPVLSYSANVSYNYSGQWRPAFFSRSFGGSIGASHIRGPFTVSASMSQTSGRNGTTDQNWISHMFKREDGEWEVNCCYGSLNRKFAHSSSQMISINVDYRPKSWWQHSVVLGRNHTSFSVESEAPRFATYGDTLYAASGISGERTTMSYNTTLQPSAYGYISGRLVIGANGSFGGQTSVSGSLVSNSTSSYTDPRVSRPLKSESWGGFSQLRVGAFESMFLTLGIRGEQNPSYGRSHKIDWTPTNGLTYSVSIGDLTMKLLGSYGRATRPPAEERRREIISQAPSFSVSRYVSQVENPYLRPEYSRGPQGGIELYYGNFGSLSINHYKQTVTDLIQRIVVDTIHRYRLSDNAEGVAYVYKWVNIAKIRQTGWEGTGSANLGNLSLKGTYSWNDSRVLRSAISTYTIGQGFWGVPTHTAFVSASYTLANSSIVWTSNYVGASNQRWSDGNLIAYSRHRDRLPMYYVRLKSIQEMWRQPGYVKSDITVMHRLTPSISATLNINNVGNSYDNDVGGDASPSLGRQTLLGVSLRYPR